jgi:DNA-directed RNA polymerase subunit M/transcription elongation factor TFIIS
MARKEQQKMLDELHKRMCGGAYTHVDEVLYELSDTQINILEDLIRLYPPNTFKKTSVNMLVKNTRGIVCKVCGSEDVNVVSKQLRSADEATSKIYTCITCGNHWRVG